MQHAYFRGISLTIALLTLVMSFARLGQDSAVAQGGASVPITGYTVNCDNYRVLYSVVDPNGGYYEITANLYTASNQLLNSVLGPGQSGFAYTLDIPITPTVPEQTYLYVELILRNGSIVITTVTSVPDPCYGGGSPPAGGGTLTPTNSGWNGWTDGRLNPDPAEYYTIYCEHSSIKVYGKSSNPSITRPVLVERIPISLVEGLPSNGGQIIWNTGFLVPYTITRNGDTITITGNFGYLAPQPGSKSFNLSHCQQRAAQTEPDPGFNNFIRVGHSCVSREWVANRQRHGLWVPPLTTICPESVSQRAVRP